MDMKFDPKELTVLIVDDQDPMRKALKKIAQSMGFREVIAEFDGKDAIARLDELPIDLVVCDIYMRQISGFDVLNHLRNSQLGADRPFILVSGEASKDDIVKAADHGANDYILKPFQQQDVEKKITKVLNDYYSPSPIEQKLRLGEKQIMSGQFDKAYNTFNEVLGMDDKSQRARHSLAYALLKMGQTEEAMKTLKENIALNESYFRNFATLADIYLRQESFFDAMSNLRKELKLNPKQPNRQILMAKLLMSSGDFEAAINHLREALKESPKNGTALMAMGHAFAKLENLEKAIYYFKRLRRHHPTSTKALEAIVSYCLRENQVRKAEIALIDEKSQHKRRLDTYIVLARLYLEIEDDNKAYDVLGELFKMDPENLAGWTLMSRVEIRKKRYKEAIAALKKVIKHDPSASNFFALGEAYSGVNDIAGAVKSFERVLSINPEYPSLFMQLARCYEKSEQHVKAHLLFRLAGKMGQEKFDTDVQRTLQNFTRRRNISQTRRPA